MNKKRKQKEKQDHENEDEDAIDTERKKRRSRVEGYGAIESEGWMQPVDDRWSQVSVMTSEWERPCICIVEEILFPQKVSS